MYSMPRRSSPSMTVATTSSSFTDVSPDSQTEDGLTDAILEIFRRDPGMLGADSASEEFQRDATLVGGRAEAFVGRRRPKAFDPGEPASVFRGIHGVSLTPGSAVANGSRDAEIAAHCAAGIAIAVRHRFERAQE